MGASIGGKGERRAQREERRHSRRRSFHFGERFPLLSAPVRSACLFPPLSPRPCPAARASRSPPSRPRPAPPSRYGWLSKLGGGGVGGVARRLVLDQLGFAPVFIALMLSILILAEGRAHDVADNLKDNWADAVVQCVAAVQMGLF